MGAGGQGPRGLRADFGAAWTDGDAAAQKAGSRRVRPEPPREQQPEELEEVRRLNDEMREAMDAREDLELPDFADQLAGEMAARRGLRSAADLTDMLKVEDVMEEWPGGEAPSWHGR